MNIYMKQLRKVIRESLLNEMKQAVPTPGWGGSGWGGGGIPQRAEKAWQRRYAKQERRFWSSEGQSKIIDMEGNVYDVSSSKSAPLKMKRTDIRAKDSVYTLTKNYFGGWMLEGGGYERLFDSLDAAAEFLSKKKAVVIK